MKYTLCLIFAVGLISIAAMLFKTDVPASANPAEKPGDFVLHEWGTFTSIAGKNGVAIDWRPLNGPSDLPKFVYSDTGDSGYRATYGGSGKGDIARVRMETPVIYFYAKKAMEVNVKVRFPGGRVTEWYPQASVVNSRFGKSLGGGTDQGAIPSGVNWGTIKLVPDEIPNYMRSRLQPAYPAREIDSVLSRFAMPTGPGSKRKKFLSIAASVLSCRSRYGSTAIR